MATILPAITIDKNDAELSTNTSEEYKEYLNETKVKLEETLTTLRDRSCIGNNVTFNQYCGDEGLEIGCIVIDKDVLFDDIRNKQGTLQMYGDLEFVFEYMDDDNNFTTLQLSMDNLNEQWCNFIQAFYNYQTA